MKHEDLLERKRELRPELLSKRIAQQNKPELSRRILDRLIGLPEFRTARTVSVYVSTGTEVQQSQTPK